MAARASTGSIRDASRFMHGRLYHVLYDSPHDEITGVVLELVPRGSRVVDIACGTGELCGALTRENRCEVVGADLSLRMLRFAEKRHRRSGVSFMHADATALAGVRAGSFDCATMLFLIHEMRPPERPRAIAEGLRVARRLLVVDWHVPLPRNLHALALHFAEAMSGPAQYSSFANYLAAGGIEGVLSASGVSAAVAHRRAFSHGCCDAVVLERGESSAD